MAVRAAARRAEGSGPMWEGPEGPFGQQQPGTGNGHGPYREGEVRTADAELYAIYVDPGRYGAGIGHALLQESVRRCTAAGHDRMYLWVLKGNVRARAFYERAGFWPDGDGGRALLASSGPV